MSRISRFATTVVISGGLALAGLGLAAGTAQADPFAAQPHSWCPGQALPFNNIQWDTGVCHTWYTVPFGQGNVRMVDLHGNPLDSFISADLPAPMLTPPPPPPPPPPGTPFCSPRGALIIIPPICDEIGVDLPPGSLQR
jgi:alkanesulfonate monooxygenase SsuD/methylene tetrahydromethanopterin reductase-like flavin-dependent oxidoreductase (luciferase family)